MEYFGNQLIVHLKLWATCFNLKLSNQSLKFENSADRMKKFEKISLFLKFDLAKLTIRFCLYAIYSSKFWRTLFHDAIGSENIKILCYFSNDIPKIRIGWVVKKIICFYKDDPRITPSKLCIILRKKIYGMNRFLFKYGQLNAK